MLVIKIPRELKSLKFHVYGRRIQDLKGGITEVKVLDVVPYSWAAASQYPRGSIVRFLTDYLDSRSVEKPHPDDTLFGVYELLDETPNVPDEWLTDY